MTPRELFELLNASGGLVFLSGLGFAFIGAVATRIGKGGQTEEDGRFIGGVVVAFGIAVALIEAVAVVFALRYKAKMLADVSLMLLLAPPICCAASLYGVSLSFPLKTLGGFQRMVNLLGLTALSLGILWLLSRFHWGIVFFGGLAQAGAIFLVIAVLVRKLFLRAFSSEPEKADEPEKSEPGKTE